MQSILVLAILALAFSYALTLDMTLNQRWQLWKETHNKQYFAVEEYVRYDISFHIST
jgi:hypothetical protein